MAHRAYNGMVDEDRNERLFWMGVGGLAAIGVASVLVALRGVMLNANVAIVLVLVVVLVAAAGGRRAGAVTAVVAALSFDFFHTRPYLQLRIASRDDVETTLLLLAVGLVVGTVTARARREKGAAAASRSEIRRIYRVAELAATGDEPSDIILAAQAELTALLGLRDCRFEAPPFVTGYERLERSGAMSSRALHLRPGGFELDVAGVELPVMGRGQVLGRFVLEPEPGTGVSLESRVVAIAVADQVGAVLAAG
jgi:hypothetical protein